MLVNAGVRVGADERLVCVCHSIYSMLDIIVIIQVHQKADESGAGLLLDYCLNGSAASASYFDIVALGQHEGDPAAAPREEE